MPMELLSLFVLSATGANGDRMRLGQATSYQILILKRGKCTDTQLDQWHLN